MKVSRLFTNICTALALVAFSGVAQAGDWPGWRGPDRDDLNQEKGLLKSWPDGGPKQVWIYDQAGIGYAGFSVVDDTLYTMGFKDGSERVFALDAKTGKEKWSTDIGELFENDWGNGPRGTPTIDQGQVYALGARGDLVCLDAKTGNKKWAADLKAFGGSIPKWGYAESPLVDGDLVITTPGGKKGALLALNKKTGKEVWQSKDFKDGAQYSSAIAVDLNGKRQIIQLVMENIVGIDAKSGDLLWKHAWPGRVAVIPTPIYHDNHVFVSTGYNVGSSVIKISKNNEPSEVWINKNMKNHHGGVIKLGDHLYGYSDGAGWACLDFATGEFVWREKNALGKGAISYADGHFMCLDEKSGQVMLVKATPEGWTPKGGFTLSPQTKQRKPKGKIWTHPVVANGLMYLRDQEYIYAYDVKAK